MNVKTTEARATSIASEDVEERGTLSERILFWLLKHPYQRLSDLAFALQVHSSTIWRHLISLKEQGLIESITSALVAPNRPEVLSYLTTRGIEHLSELVGTAPAQLAQMWQINEAELVRQLPQLQCTLRLQDVVQGLIAEAPRQLASSGGHPAAIRWHWQRNYHHTFERKGKQLQCRADAAVVFRRRSFYENDQDESWHCLLFLFDAGLRGSYDLHLMRERLEQLLLWRESSERWSIYRAFPPLLIVTPSAHQRDLWRQCAQEATTHLRVAPMKGACAMFVDGSPWRFSWQMLDGSGATSLLPMMEPMSPQAIPPGLLAPKHAKPINETTAKGPSERQIVIGGFEARARRLEIQRTTLKTAEHPFLSLRLCHRHAEVLKEVYALPLVALQELAALVRMEVATMRRYLYDLHDFGCLEPVATTRGKRLTLTERGLRLLAALLGVSFLHIAEREPATQRWQQRGVGHALRLVEHTAGVYGFLARLQQHAWKSGQELLWWETLRSFRRYRYQNTWHNLMPDALLGYRGEANTVEAWLEWDTGSMHRRPLTKKFEAYAHYVRSRQYRQEHLTPPKLLLVMPHYGREQMIRRVAASILGTLPLTFWTTTEQLLQVQGPLAAIWKKGGLKEDEQEEVARSSWLEEGRFR